MRTNEQASEVRGKVLRFSWDDGPTAGTTYEHVFHDDGTVEWRGVDGDAAMKPGAEPRTVERPKFADEEVSRTVRLVSYLAESGYTLTVALNFEDGSLVGIASNEKTWMPIHGSFEVMGA